jgi:PAS domain S-box-containing protein
VPEGWLSTRDAELAAVLEAAPDAVVVSDWEGRILFVNEQARVMFGYAGDDLLGRQIETLVPARQRAAHVAHRSAYRQAPRRRPMGAALDLVAVRRDGSELPVDISLSTLETHRGRVVISFVRDATEARRLRQAGRELEFEMVEDGTATSRTASAEAQVLHDVNNYLAVILANANLALAVIEPEQPGYAEFVAVERAARQAGERTRRIEPRPPA